MNVVLTREAGRNDEARAWLPKDAKVFEVPLTATTYVALDDVTRELEGLDNYGSFRALVVTSARGAGYAATARGALAQGARIISVGPATTRSLSDQGIEVTAEAPSKALEIATFISEGPVLQLGASAMRDELAAELAARRIVVDRVACYETVRRELGDEEKAVLEDADVVLIGAPSAWNVARDHVRPETWVVVPGATTADVVRAEHESVLEGWGPQLRATLATLDR